MNLLTQEKIAFIASFTILFIGYGILLSIHYLLSPFSLWVFIVPILTAVINYIITLYFIEIFLLRSIRKLYRTVGTIQKFKNKESLHDPELFDKLRMQLEVYASQKVNEIERLKDNEKFRKEFLGNVSHELKTPLFSIQGFAEILLSDQLTEEQKNNYVHKIIKNTSRLSTIVSDLLTITKAENNELSLVKEKFYLLELINEVLSILEVKIKSKKIQINIQTDHSELIQVLADRFRISQILQNLLENAINYNPEKTTITIQSSVIEKKILVEVIDDGLGIEEKHLSRIFERFYRVDQTRSREHGGSGLGLSIVKNIIEAHDQSISVHSEVGKGTTFAFTLDKG